MAKRKGNQPGQKQEQRWNLPMGSHVWAYLRHSPGDNQTIESQQLGLRQWSEQLGLIIDREFIDAGVEGSKEEREHFQEMLALARQTPRPVDGIIVWSFSRFARDLLDAQFYKADLRKRGYVILSKTDDIPDNEMAPFFELMADWKNQRFLEDLSADVSRGLSYLVQRGFWPTGKPPVGYKVEKVEMGQYRNGSIRYGNHLVKDEAVAERVALAWKMKLNDNASYLDIYEATHLYGQPTHYLYMFDNLLYTGVFTYDGKRYPTDWEQGERFCESYISLDEYKQVQANRQARIIENVAPRTLSSRYLLSGILQCGVCAGKGKKVPLVGGSGGTIKPNYFFYRCGSKVKERGAECKLSRHPCWRIDDAVIELLQGAVLTPSYIQSEIERANALLSVSQEDLQSKIADAMKSVQVTEKRVEGIVELIAQKGMTPILEKQYDAVNNAWKEASSLLSSLRLRLAQGKSNTIDVRNVFHSLDEMKSALDVGPVEKRRDFIKRFVECVIVYPDHIEVKLKFRLDLLKLRYPGSEKALTVVPFQGAYDTALPRVLGRRFCRHQFAVPVRRLCMLRHCKHRPKFLGWAYCQNTAFFDI